MTRFVCRRYNHNDIDTYFNVFKKLVNQEFPIYSIDQQEYMLTNKRGWSKANWEKYHTNKYHYIYGAWDGDTLVGILLGLSEFSGVAFLTWLMIDSAYQRKGAGKFLAGEFENMMKKKGQHAVFLWCEDKNRPFYEKLGYKHEARIPNLWLGITTNMMVKQLQKPHPTPWVLE